jgi:hypothetical protein
MNPITDNFVYILMADIGEYSEFFGVFDSEEKARKRLDEFAFYVRDVYYIIKQELNYPEEKETIDI